MDTPIPVRVSAADPRLAQAVSIPVSVQETLSAKLRRLRQSCSLLGQIQKAARYCVAESLVGVLEICVSKNDVPAWTSLLTFAYRAFPMPDSPGERRESLTTMVKRNLARCDDLPAQPDKRKWQNDGKSRLRNAVERKIQAGNISGAVRILSSDDSVTLPTADILDVLKKKHPTVNTGSDYPPPPSEDDALSQSVTAEEILHAICSFPNGSAGGLDGLLPQHLKDLVAGSVGEISVRLCERLAALVNLMLKGKVPHDICPLLYGASLTALKKKDGVIRPIAVGCTLRRIAGKVVSRRVMEGMGQLTRPTQLGYGTRGGAEAAVHATRAYVSETEETRVMLKLDFRNAFNTVHRDKMLTAVRYHLPQYFSFIWQMYRHPSYLFFRRKLLHLCFSN